MKATFSIENIEQIKELEDTIKKLPNIAEGIINEYLHTTGAENSITMIKAKMPCSKGPPSFKRKKSSNAKFSSGKKQPTTNAKFSDSLKATPINLGFIIETTPSFWYLMFPALGIGNSYKYLPNDFMNKGINATLPRMISNLKEDLIEKLEEKL